MIPANKEPSHQIKETEAGCYHVEFTKTMRPIGRAFEGEKRSQKQIFSIRDFNQIIEISEGTEWPDGRTKRAGVGFLPLNWQRMRILHDPILWNAAQAEAGKEADRQANLEAEKLAEAAKVKAAETKPKGRPKKV